jgi:GNAT superfamily N-acetyltransferase
VRASDIDGSIAAAMETLGADVRLRTLRSGERERWLELLDGWLLPDGWRGRDFFRRYAEQDPTFADRNVWIAEVAGRMVATAQIFPRRLRIAGTEVPTGGIGSVFTRDEARGTGVASSLLLRCQDDLRERGMPLSLLFASRHGFYERLGWRLWARSRGLWLRPPAAPPPDPRWRLEAFDPARDLEDAYALHAAYGASRPGTVVRDASFFRAQLAYAGNPGEDFVLARDGDGALVAYARGAVLDGVYLVTELARRPGPEAAGALAGLVEELMRPRDPDPIAPSGRPSAELRRLLVAPPVTDPELSAALAAREVVQQGFESRDAMFAVLDAAALARHVGAPIAAGEAPEAYLARILPPECLTFWPADRF